MNDAELVREFQICGSRVKTFTHEQHLRVAWFYLQREPRGLAVERYKHDLKRLATWMGKPQLYHETITWAYMVLLAERRLELPPEAPFEQVAQLWPALLDHGSGLLRNYYSQEELDDPVARVAFRLPRFHRL